MKKILLSALTGLLMVPAFATEPAKTTAPMSTDGAAAKRAAVPPAVSMSVAAKPVAPVATPAVKPVVAPAVKPVVAPVVKPVVATKVHRKHHRHHKVHANQSMNSHHAVMKEYRGQLRLMKYKLHQDIKAHNMKAVEIDKKVIAQIKNKIKHAHHGKHHVKHVHSMKK